METDHAAACRYFTPGDACRVAVEAYRAAAATLHPPTGEPWMIDGQPYATPADFADGFMAELAARLGLLALDRLGTFAPPEVRACPWQLASSADPEKMRRIISSHETAFLQAGADFMTRETHELREGDNRLHNAEGEVRHG